MAKRFHKEDPYFHHNRIRFIRNGPAYFAAVYKLLDETKEEIHVQTYIFEEDETGNQMADALIRTAQRGVRIDLLVDAFGSKALSEKTISRMKQAGIRMRLFGPLLSKGKIHFGRRLHQKILISDRRKAIIAGVNISNNYSGIKEREPWLDFGVLVEGDVMPSLVKISLRVWLGFGMKRILRRVEKSRIVAGVSDTSFHVRMRPLENDGLRGKYQCTTSYLQLINSAVDSIDIVGGYFLPGGRARRALRKAIQRGVRIRVILAEKSDVGLMHRGIQYLYAWLLRNRIEIYEYQPSNVHGKVLVADGKVVSVGSYDLNNLSTYSNIELNMEVDDKEFAMEVKQELENVIRFKCHTVTMTELESRFSIWQRFRLWYSYRVLKIMFVLAVWLATKENEQR
jgi:cardiolipin synthase A/B